MLKICSDLKQFYDRQIDTCCSKPIKVCSNDCDEQSHLKTENNMAYKRAREHAEGTHGSASLVPIPSPGARKAAKQFVFKEILHP